MNMKKYSCPKCGHDIEPKNINASKDIVYCSGCGEVSSFLSIVGKLREANAEDEERRLLNAPPPKHLKVVSDPTDMTGRISFVYRKFSPMAIFLVPFTCAWGGGSLSMLYGRQISSGQFSLHDTLFGLPFLIGTVVLVSMSLFMIFGKRVLTIERGQGRYFFGVGPIGFSRRFKYDHRTRVRKGETSYSVGGSKGGRGGHPLPELHLTHPDSANTIHVCAGMSDDALAYVAAVLRREAARV